MATDLPADIAANPAAPLVSIVMPCHNAAETLEDCLATIAQQSLTNFELIAIDDGSNDNTLAILKATAQQDPRLRILKPGRIGLVAALNQGIAAAQASVIARMDADDLMHLDRLLLQHQYLADHLEVDLISCQVKLFPEALIQAGNREYVRWQNTCLTPKEIGDRIYIESPLPHPSIMIRSRILRDIGGYRSGLFPEDYDLWLRLHQAGKAMAKLPQVLLSWRESCDRTSRTDPRYDRPAFNQLRAQYLSQDQRLLKACQQDRPLVIWGAGKKTRRRVRLLTERLATQQISLTAWIDIDPKKIGRDLWDIPIHPPEWLAQFQITDTKPFLLIYVTKHGSKDDIAEQIKAWDYHEGRDFLAVG